MNKLKTINFDLDSTLSCGQVFRWHRHNNGFWYGFINGKIVKLKQLGDYIYFDGQAAREDIIKYFNLKINYKKILGSIAKDPFIRKAVRKYYGLRIIKQDPFECLISYIFSSQNNIPRINKIADELSKRTGKKTRFEGQDYFAFPQLTDLKGCCRKDIHACRLGFRDKYLDDAVGKLCTKDVDLKKIVKLPYQKAKEELLKIKGVGNKIADCVLLFAFNKYEAFPVDVWIERVMKKYYKGKDGSYFGKYAGYAQEFLYAYIKNI
ncbi:MAG: DNA glycosylase [bacterium]